MIKLDISDEIKELHLAYCYKKIDFKDDIEITVESLEYINVNIANEKVKSIIKTKVYTTGEINNIHKAFIQFCKSKAKDIAIGTPYYLRKIVKAVKKNYPIIDFMFGKDDIKVKIPGNTKEYKYSELVLNMYKYNEFITFNSTSNNEFEYREEDKKDISKEIHTKYKNISCVTAYKLTEILYEKWKISKSNILNRIKNHDVYKYWNAYTYVFLIDLKSCPYCNRQYITPIFHEKGRLRGDLDHFFSKDKHPYLSMSIYNLVPCCKFCNSSLKGTKEFEMDGLHPYEHSFDDYIEFKYEIKNNQVEINLVDKEISDIVDIQRYKDMFMIKEQYRYHTNIVNELIHKKIMFNDEYIKDMVKKLEKLDISEERIKEIIIGYVADKNNINNEPLSKLKRDIVKQLGFDKKKDDKINEDLITNLKSIDLKTVR